jgi:CspA family cold shock protein
MKNGTVKFFNESKGFGFITDSETKEDFFVHISGVNEEIREGDEVQYELREGRKETIQKHVVQQPQEQQIKSKAEAFDTQPDIKTSLS